MSHTKLELLAPAGDMERLVSAVRYGANAVYLAGKSFGMRAAPQNFGDAGAGAGGSILPRKTV